MSTSIAQFGNFGAPQILLNGINAMGQEQTALSWQTSTGVLGETYADLGTGCIPALSVPPKITQVSNWQSNIKMAQTTLDATSTGLTSLVDLAQKFNAKILDMLNTSSPDTVSATSQEAKEALSTIANVLNTSDGSGFIFAGQNATQVPIPDASSIATGPLAQAIKKAVDNLVQNGASSVMQSATTDSASNAQGMSIFSSDLSIPPQQASALQNQLVSGSDIFTGVGIVATQAPVSDTQASTPSTGSPIRDLIRDMMIIAVMPDSMSSETKNFPELIKTLHTSMTNTINQIINMQTSVGVNQSALTTRSNLLSNIKLSLQSQLANAKDANMAQTATELSSLNTRLRASYMLISQMKGMTLANYI